jgi:hypothetical protein
MRRLPPPLTVTVWSLPWVPRPATSCEVPVTMHDLDIVRLSHVCRYSCQGHVPHPAISPVPAVRKSPLEHVPRARPHWPQLLSSGASAAENTTPPMQRDPEERRGPCLAIHLLYCVRLASLSIPRATSKIASAAPPVHSSLYGRTRAGDAHCRMVDGTETGHRATRKSLADCGSLLATFGH